MYRYPGIKPFQFEESNLFFGRTEDTERLTKLISLEKLVVLYSKSGYGKSSLINAGLLPALAKMGGTKYFNVRFGAYSPDNNNLMDKFRAFLFLVGKKSYLNKIIPQENSLWYFLKKYQESATFRSRSRYLIVFDQFEELFTFPQEQQDEFKKQLAEALYVQIPQNFRTVVEQKLKQDRNFLTADEREDLYRPLELHILFSIRSDRMSLLNQVKDFIPQILQTCYELQALSRTQAEDAILIPAGYSKKDISFDSPPFDYSDAALNAMLNYLTDGNKKNIESFQLQIICQYIESLSVEQQISEIEPQHLGNIHDIFNNYYENSIAKLSSSADQQAAHLFIEEKLIVDERRISLDKALCLKSVTEPVLQSLADSRILRSEPNTTGGTSYEISHDTLVAPILSSRKLRLEQEEEERAEQERLDELRIAKERAEHERQERQKERKRQRKVIAMVGSVAVVAIVFLIVAVFLFFDAKRQKTVAYQQKQVAVSKTIEAEQKSKALAAQQKELEKALKAAEQAKNTAEAEKIKAQLAKNLAEQKRVEAEIAKNKAETMAEAVMPSEAKQNPFEYFWKKGKVYFKEYNYLEAYTAMLMAKNANNSPKNKIDSVNQYFKEITWYYEKYKKASGLFYDREPSTAKFTEAKKLFYEIHDRNSKDSLSWFLGKASADFRTEDMVLIMGGTFERVDGNNGNTKQTVTLSPYRIAKYEVSHAQYARFLNEYSAKHKNQKVYLDSIQNDFIGLNEVFSSDMKCGIYLDNGVYKITLGYENRPFAYVNWYGADAFCRFYQVSLPTEAQWEFAARGGEDNVYSGSDSSEEVAWFVENSKNKTHPCGTKKQNKYGLYDMSGNLCEWCWDWDGDYSEGSVFNPKGHSGGNHRVLRGGSWANYASSSCVVDRFNYPPFNRNYNFGFRLVFGSYQFTSEIQTNSELKEKKGKSMDGLRL